MIPCFCRHVIQRQFRIICHQPAGLLQPDICQILQKGASGFLFEYIAKIAGIDRNILSHLFQCNILFIMHFHIFTGHGNFRRILFLLGRREGIIPEVQRFFHKSTKCPFIMYRFCLQLIKLPYCFRRQTDPGNQNISRQRLRKNQKEN